MVPNAPFAERHGNYWVNPWLKRPRPGNANVDWRMRKMAQASPTPMCPMADTCGRMMSRRRMGVAPFFMGAIFIFLGIAIIVEPRIIVWALAAMFIFMGIMMLVMASFMRRMGERFHTMKKSMG